MSRYRKKPVEIDAMQWRGSNPTGELRLSGREIVAWVNDNGGEARYEQRSGVSGIGLSRIGRPSIVVRTLEGWICASPGDYMIRGVQGEFYPCKPDIFEATYEPVGAS